MEISKIGKAIGQLIPIPSDYCMAGNSVVCCLSVRTCLLVLLFNDIVMSCTFTKVSTTLAAFCTLHFLAFSISEAN